MNKRLPRIFLSGILAAFIIGAAINPAATPVFAAEQTSGQDQQNSPVDAPQSEQNIHAGHHATS
jgi:hypothetical protein